MKELLIEVFKSDIAVEMYGWIFAMLVGYLMMYLRANYFKQSKAVSVAERLILDVANRVEKGTPENTKLDGFLDAFIKEFEKEHGRKPRAEELKTALDVKGDIKN